MNYKDPVCGMTVDPKQAEASGLTLEHGGQTYYFCSVSCKETFRTHPEAHTNAGRGRRHGTHGHHCC